jgi:hypothetical protein
VTTVTTAPFEQKYPGVKIGVRGKNLPAGSYYGYATGIPAFDEKAARKWNSKKYYTDPEYYNSKRDAITRMKEVAVFDRPYVRRAAIVGAESLSNVFYEALKTFSRREFPRFNTREEAMNWLVREET